MNDFESELVKQTVLSVVGDALDLPVAEIDTGKTLVEIGMDSIEFVEMCIVLEEKLDVRLVGESQFFPIQNMIKAAAQSLLLQRSRCMFAQ